MRKKDEARRDDVARLREWQARHPEATYHKPPSLSGEHSVTWPRPDADPARDGVPDRPAHHDLGKLMDYLEALERATLGAR
jgi:hypothetical protein